MILVDTDVWIDFFTGSEPGAGAVEQLLIHKRAAVSAITIFEMLAGVTGKRRLDQIEALLEVVPSVPLSPAAAEIAAAIYTDLKASGRLVGNEDILLAATALERQIPILTRNRRHFERIPGLDVTGPDDLLEDHD